MNPTNDPSLRSWLPVSSDSDFPIQNLPFGIFRRRDGSPPAVGVAIGEYVLDVSILSARGLFDGPALRRLTGGFGPLVLNPFLDLGRPAWSEARATISRLLR